MVGIIKTLEQLRAAGKLPNYIEYVKFPRFKDLEEDTQIDFSFPMTILIGANGTRKSSVLKGLQGCPKGKTPQTYWFSTAMDPIKEVDGNNKKNSIIHGYKSTGGDIVECLKVRTDKKGRTLDYWETSKPSKTYGMLGKKRHDPIIKHVEYLNFRSLLPAFDKCFYYSGRSQVQDYIRNKTRKLNKVIASGSVDKVGVKQNPQNDPRIVLKDDELKHISNILGKAYVEGVYIRHKFFDGWAETIRLNTTHHAYSEAFAGSGEIAVAILVQRIENTPIGSLIILDEPEVSLHPEAQKRLREYLLAKIKTHKHQIIISTHSPFMAEGLPKEAIKAFRLSSLTGKTEVIQNISAQEAFSVIGHQLPASDKKVIWVEDLLGEKVVNAVIKTFDAARQSLFEVRVMGPNSQMCKDMGHACDKTEVKNHYYCFDGDSTPSFTDFPQMELTALNEKGLCDINLLSHGNVNLTYLAKVIKCQSKQDPKNIGLELSENTDVHFEKYKAYLKFMATNAFYLPGQNPEFLIWSDAYARDMLTLISVPPAKIAACMDNVAAEPNPKKKFVLYCEALTSEPVDSSKILHEQEKFVAKFVHSNGIEVQKIIKMINEMTVL